MISAKPKRVTLKDVAEKAGVSIAAASTVLSGPSTTIRVHETTGTRVLNAAAELGYIRRPKRIASVFNPPISKIGRGQVPSTKTLNVAIIGFCDPTLTAYSMSTNPWDHDIVGGVESRLSRRGGVRIRFYNRRRIGMPPVALPDILDIVKSDGIDAIVVIDLDLAEIVDEQAQELEATGLPFVIISSGPLASPVANVCYDNKAAGYQAAAHLIAEGHREITFLAPNTSDWADLRLAGAYAATRALGLPESAFRTVPSQRPSIEPAREWIETKTYMNASMAAVLADLNAGARHRAVIAMNDEVALGYLYAATSFGLRAFEDFALVGFDDMPEVRLRGISTLRAPLEEMGREAASLLLELCSNGNNRARRRICLQSDLVVRPSSVDYKFRL